MYNFQLCCYKCNKCSSNVRISVNKAYKEVLISFYFKKFLCYYDALPT